MGILRSAPQVIIPLYGSNLLGLNIETIGIIIGASSVIDFSLFYPAGLIMDHYGRKYGIVSSVCMLTTGIMILPFSSAF